MFPFLRCIRELGFARRPVGFPRAAMLGFDRCRPGRDWRDPEDG